MAAPSASPNPSSPRRPARSSEVKWREIFLARLAANRKKGLASSSLFLDWKKDVKDSSPSPKNLR